MQVLPFVQVRELAPSASYYAAITQPLGLRYISASPSSIVFGDASSGPLFEVKQRTDSEPQPCRLILSAKSIAAVAAFHSAALRANPALEDAGPNTNYIHLNQNSNIPGESVARVRDFDANIMEVVHGSAPDYSASKSQVGSVVSRHSSAQEVSRVLDWNLDVGTTAVASRTSAGSIAPSTTVFQRSVTTSTVESTPRENPQGSSISSVLGAVFGVAVGAAVGGAMTYSMMKNEQQQREPVAFQGYEQPPPINRRATYPDQVPPADNRSRYYPPSSYTGARSRVVEELDDRASRHSSQYTTGTSRTRGRSETGSTRRPPLMITDYEHRSNAGSKVGGGDAPKLLMDAEHRSVASCSKDNRSHAGSRHNNTPRRHSPPDADLRSYVGARHASSSSRPRDADADTYVSARSERSSATVRQAAAPRSATVETAPPSRAPSQAGSRYSGATVKGGPGGGGGSSSSSRRAPSQVSLSARSSMAPPESHFGWDDDMVSIAPSDSISNIGARPPRWSSQRV
ncbi:hypothetical protein M426DRAFT_325100 [Hypoxylon sp. CI-4A]|nr:hypothetical protein M426DRAFT_325100 [Hypoxylon sp. CI-4A]